MSRVFMIHGYGGTPDEGWRPWMRTELGKRGHEVFIPAMPDTQHPRVGPWVQKIREVVGQPKPDDIFIGHSLGCIAIIRYLLTLRDDQSIGKAILVAGFYEELGEEYAELHTFLDDPIDWNAVRSRCSTFVVIHSEDDDAVPVARARSLASQLKVDLELHSGYGHFSGGDDIRELPLLLRHVA